MSAVAEVSQRKVEDMSGRLHFPGSFTVLANEIKVLRVNSRKSLEVCRGCLHLNSSLRLKLQQSL